MESPKTASIEDIKALRVQADALLQAIRNLAATAEPTKDFDDFVYKIAEMAAYRAATEAKMWLGKMLEGIGNPFPAELADKSK